MKLEDQEKLVEQASMELPENTGKQDVGSHAHGTGEWAVRNENIQTGCEGGCLYCFGKASAIRFGRATPESWVKPVLRQSALNRQFRPGRGRIMFPSTHDITPWNLDACIVHLEHMLAPGNKVLVVTKPYLACIKALCRALQDRKKQVLFRFTVGSTNNDVLAFWEPGAPRFRERLAALRHAYKAGFGTSVSCEPMLDDNIQAVVSAVAPYVTDAVWLGKANRLKQIISLTCPGDTEVARRADELIGTQTDEQIGALYKQFAGNPKIRWKDSIKQVIGMERPTEKGLDI